MSDASPNPSDPSGFDAGAVLPRRSSRAKRVENTASALATPGEGGRAAPRSSAVRVEVGQDKVTLCDALDRVLTKGVVAKGEITISVANVDLVYLGFNALLASVETARAFVEGTPLPDDPPSAGGER
jgi:hypothetical protein